MTLPDNVSVLIERAELAGNHAIRVTFSDGAVRTIDFGPFLRRSRNPLIQVYLDMEAFSRFTVKDGDLMWGDYDLCFPIADLYENRL